MHHHAASRFQTPLPLKARTGCAALVMGLVAALGGLGVDRPAIAQQPVAEAPALQPLPALSVAPYMGRWYQVAYYPNFFQRQCVADTSATYREIGNGTVEVTNRCRTASGGFDQVIGVARPVVGVSKIEAGLLQPARLEVSFLPPWLRWTGVGWGAYWVIDWPDHGRYAIVSEGRREYLWVLSRTPDLRADDRQTVRARLQALGFDLERLKDHPQSEAPQALPRPPGS
ncbi:MAG: lipocalin family protein [Burkholderiaceae bacterium]|jgi:apolipoprotein D and lipocalin family protein